MVRCNINLAYDLANLYKIRIEKVIKKYSSSPSKRTNKHSRYVMIKHIAYENKTILKIGKLSSPHLSCL